MNEANQIRFELQSVPGWEDRSMEEVQVIEGFEDDIYELTMEVER